MLVVDSLPGVVRLNYLRRLLADGFQAHMQNNPLLHQARRAGTHVARAQCFFIFVEQPLTILSGSSKLLMPLPLAPQIFNFRPRGEPAERLTGLEKRLFKGQSSAESKDRTRQRKTERAMMSSYKHHSFLHGE